MSPYEALALMSLGALWRCGQPLRWNMCGIHICWSFMFPSVCVVITIQCSREGRNQKGNDNGRGQQKECLKTTNDNPADGKERRKEP